jgi:crossover junction endodeoxyribonuclease RusA
VSTFALVVPGKPLPKGSLKHVGRGRLVEQTKVKGWMKEIQAHILEAYRGVDPLFVTPVRATLQFHFPRPAAAKNRLYPHLRSAGDLDKLVRAVLDALQPSVLADDSLVVHLAAGKFYETPEQPAGVTILIEDLT